MKQSKVTYKSNNYYLVSFRRYIATVMTIKKFTIAAVPRHQKETRYKQLV